MNQPLRLKNHSITVPDDNTKVMIEIQHGDHLVLVFNVTHLTHDVVELGYFEVKGLLLHQSLYNFLKVEPTNWNILSHVRLQTQHLDRNEVVNPFSPGARFSKSSNMSFWHLRSVFQDWLLFFTQISLKSFLIFTLQRF